MISIDGVALYSSVFDRAMLECLIEAVDDARTSQGAAGTIRMLGVGLIREVATRGPVLNLAKSAVGDGAFPVRAILFDKRPGTNWKLAFHQDRAIAVKERRDVPGFSGWSVKEGVPHVLPPAPILQQMVSVRLHLDDCGVDNGPLRVSPGTHKLGILDKAQIPDVVRSNGVVVCTCNAGDALLMKPLLLHASSKADNPSHRRVIHIEYAARELPGGLEWYERSVR